MTSLPVLMLATAYGADLLIGDPQWFPHPVRGMGVAIEQGERMLRRLIAWEKAAGILLTLALVSGSFAVARWLMRTAFSLSAPLGFMVGSVLLWSCLSTKDLAHEARQVLAALLAGDLMQARRQVSRIVGRDTHQLDEPEAVRATIETLAESTLDGILSPLVYFVIGGVPLAIAYKAVNTMDSMIGHRSARYLQFGWAAAKLDTLANWIPARLCAFLFTAAAWLCGDRAGAAWRCAWRDGSRGPVPNAAIPEAAMAGALGVRLGGTNWYEGKAVMMPPMGDPIRPIEPPRIREAIRLMYACSLTGWVIAMGALLYKTTIAP